MKILFALALIAAGSPALHAQVSEANQAQASQISSSDEAGISTGVVIIDGDELGVVVVPNPGGNIIYIKSATVLTEAKQYTIYGSNGITLTQQKLVGKSIDVSALSNGEYYLVLSDVSGHIIGRASFMVQH